MVFYRVLKVLATDRKKKDAVEMRDTPQHLKVVDEIQKKSIRRLLEVLRCKPSSFNHFHSNWAYNKGHDKLRISPASNVCLIIFANEPNSRYRLVLAANRDE